MSPDEFDIEDIERYLDAHDFTFDIDDYEDEIVDEAPNKYLQDLALMFEQFRVKEGS